MSTSPALTGIRVLECAGLAPGPFTGLLLADNGATVLRIDRAPLTPQYDPLARRKTSICVNFKSPTGISLIKELVKHADVFIDPYRPGVLERLGLCPTSVLLKLNPRLIVARMTGFRRDGKYANMAGHDINYISVSGVLSMLGRKGEPPYPPGNLLGDFAGGGSMCFLGIMLALFEREKSGLGQVVEANMVDGSAYLATSPRFTAKNDWWNRERGENVLDGGCPWYGVYETKDGGFMAVGALEPQFFSILLDGLGIQDKSLMKTRDDRTTWPSIRELLTTKFKQKTRKDWESVFDRLDACVTPVLSHSELEQKNYDQRPAVTLRRSPFLAIKQMDGNWEERDVVEGQGSGVHGSGYDEDGLGHGEGGEETLNEWFGWKRGMQYDFEEGGLILRTGSKL